MRWPDLLLVALLAAASGGEPEKKPGPAEEKLPASDKNAACCGYPLGEFRLTFYWIAVESDSLLDDSNTMLYTQRGFPLGLFPEKFVADVSLEGTGLLADGRVVNYDGACAYGTGRCFDTLPAGEFPFGRGVQGRALLPFRSVAVDPRIIPIGEAIYLPELDGIELPDGSLHDGCVRADDQGGGIKERKMDFFVASYDDFLWVADRMWWRLKATPHVEEPRCGYLAER
jgi:3D (Asp-Asp-Asp) domain-containing protein